MEAARRMVTLDPPPLGPEQHVVAVIPHAPGDELRVALTRVHGRGDPHRPAMISISRFRPLGRPRRFSGALLRGRDIPLLVDAIEAAVRKAAELGWNLG